MIRISVLVWLFRADGKCLGQDTLQPSSGLGWVGLADKAFR